jgi:hypothetical protein
MSPEELAHRVGRALDMLEEESPQWLRPGSGGA